MRRLFTHDLGLVTLSLCLAVILWFAVHREEKAVVVVNVPIQLRHIPEETVVVSQAADMVSVRLKGAKSLLSGFIPSQVELPQGKSVRLRRGENYLHIDSKQISVPPGIEVLGVTPSSIRIVLERTTTKELPVLPCLEGSPPRGFFVKGATASPATVAVRGPERELREVVGVATEPIPVDGKTRTFSEVVYLEPPVDHTTWEGKEEKEKEVMEVSVTVEIIRRER